MDDGDTGLRQRRGGPQRPSSRRFVRRGERGRTAMAKYLASTEPPRASSTTPSLSRASGGGWMAGNGAGGSRCVTGEGEARWTTGGRAYATHGYSTIDRDYAADGGTGGEDVDGSRAGECDRDGVSA